MGYDGWMTYNGVELINLDRTTEIAESLGISAVWVRNEDVAWIGTALAPTAYKPAVNAPWYDAGFPASAEFAGVIPLSVQGLDDSTGQSTVVEYVNDKGNSGKSRNGTLPLVFSVALVGVTERAVKYGLTWMNKVLSDSGNRALCVGADLKYFNDPSPDSLIVHHRDVKVTRASSVTRKRNDDCSVTWLVTFTMTAADPYEYGEAVPVLANLGLGTVSSPQGLNGSGVFAMTYQSCPVYDYTPVYDPLYPALVPGPVVPSFFPDGWNISEGMGMLRWWARIRTPAPALEKKVPIFTVSGPGEARRVKISVFPGAASQDVQCDPIFAVVVNYMPPNQMFYVDGQEEACYLWDGSSAGVRRTDSLVYSVDARPVDWTAFTDPNGLLITLDEFATDTDYEGARLVRVGLALVNRTD